MRAKCAPSPPPLPLSIDTRLSDHDCIGFFIVPRCSCSPSSLLKRELRVRASFSPSSTAVAAPALFLLRSPRSERVFNTICVLWLREDNQLPDTCFSWVPRSLEIRRECGGKKSPCCINRSLSFCAGTNRRPAGSDVTVALRWPRSRRTRKRSDKRAKV